MLLKVIWHIKSLGMILKEKNYLKSLEKYYVSDLGLKHHLLGYRNRDRGFMLENVVYLELIRRGFDVYIGKKRGKKKLILLQKTKINYTIFKYVSR